MSPGEHAPPAPGLSSLERVSLLPEREALLEHLATTSQGSPAWRARKRAEARDLFALEALAPRLQVLALDMRTELLAVVRLTVPTPCLPPGGGLLIREEADLALRFPEELLRRPLPGHALVQIPRPRPVWHSNVSADPVQALCLGANVPRGLPLREAVLASYAALTLQSVSLDLADPAGIVNPAALAFWNDRRDRIPLSTEAFLDPPAQVDTGLREPEEDPA